MSTVEIRVTRYIGAALSDTDIGGWMVSYVKRQFQTKHALPAPWAQSRTRLNHRSRNDE